MGTCSSWCNRPYGFFPHGSSFPLVFNLDHFFVILKSSGCSDFMLAMEIHTEFVENSAVYDSFYLTGITPSRHQEQRKRY